MFVCDLFPRVLNYVYMCMVELKMRYSGKDLRNGRKKLMLLSTRFQEIHKEHCPQVPSLSRQCEKIHFSYTSWTRCPVILARPTVILLTWFDRAKRNVGHNVWVALQEHVWDTLCIERNNTAGSNLHATYLWPFKDLLKGKINLSVKSYKYIFLWSMYLWVTS